MHALCWSTVPVLPTEGAATPQRRLWLVLLVAVAVGGAFVLVVPPGLPYDEPAHWGNILFYADHGRMPVLGEVGATYESQMGPVYYALLAPMLALTGHGGLGFYLVRTLSLGAGLLLIGFGTFRATRILGKPQRTAVWAVALVVFNPGILAIGSSVSNDLLVVGIVSVVTWLGLRTLKAREPRLLDVALVGALAGLAILTKVVAIAIAMAFGITLLTSGRSLMFRLRALAVTVVAAAVTSGWWFVRNLVLYGDLTGATALESTGVAFPRADSGILSNGRTLASQMLTYAFAPVEYYRNVVQVPKALEATIICCSILLVITMLAAWMSPRPASEESHALTPLTTWLVMSILVTLAAYIYFYVTTWAIPPRLLAISATPASLLVVSLLDRRSYRWLPFVILTTYSLGIAWLLWSLARAELQTYLPLG